MICKNTITIFEENYDNNAPQVWDGDWPFLLKKKKSVLEAKTNDKNIYLGEVISLSSFRAYFHLRVRLPINVSKLFRRETR